MLLMFSWMYVVSNLYWVAQEYVQNHMKFWITVESNLNMLTNKNILLEEAENQMWGIVVRIVIVFMMLTLTWDNYVPWC